MSDTTKTWDDLRLSTEQTEKAKNKLLSPDPTRKKYITELLHAFAQRKISFADLTRMDKKKIRQVAEMGFVRLRHGRYEEARKIFEMLTFLDHKNYFHHLALASAYQKLGKLVDAIFQYSETLKLAKDNINALVNRGELYIRQRNYRKAAEDFRKAIILDQSGKDLFANRARSLVVAIKRSLERDKDIKSGKIPAPKAQVRKKISPIKLVTPRKSG